LGFGALGKFNNKVKRREKPAVFALAQPSKILRAKATWPEGFTLGRFGNRRYGRLGNLRYENMAAFPVKVVGKDQLDARRAGIIPRL
jgi:hypothetical protein